MTSPSFMPSGLNKRFSLDQRKRGGKKKEETLTFPLICPYKMYVCSSPLITVLIREDLKADKLQTRVK